MPQICPRCQRANPNEATFCYNDGFVLQQGAVVSPAGQLAREFVFTGSGKRCRTVEEIAQCCRQDWNEAREILRRGEFERFFSQVGRLDLASTAADAVENPDPDVALFRFVNNLPVSVNALSPRLDLTPRRIKLGSLKAGEQRQMKLTVLNHGKGLLQGKVAVTDGDPWLKLVDGLDPTSCPIKATQDQDVTVRVDSRGLVAGQAYSGKLTVVTNGGIAEVPLRLDVEPVAFTRPPFQGATSPRGMAERMRTNPKPAVPLLESGEVQRWFEANGWKYPVPGAPARGVGSVQQFFECLGLSKPPPVMLSESEMRFEVTAPDVARGQVALRTATKKWVYAQIESDVPWLRPTKPSVSGPQQAQIGFEIDSAQMNGRPQQDAVLRVLANGGQRLALRVRVTARFPRDFVPPTPAPVAAVPVPVVARAVPVPALPVPALAALPVPALPVPARPVAIPVPVVETMRMPAPVATGSRPAAVPTIDWLPQPIAEKPRPAPRASIGVQLLRPLIVGIVLALVFRVLLAGPAEVWARVLITKVEHPSPGSLEMWKHSPLERRADGSVLDPGFLHVFVLTTFWVGGLAGAWLVMRRGGTSADVLFGGIAGAAGGVPAAATAACIMVVLDGLPRAVLGALSQSGTVMSAWTATPLWLMLVAVCWAAYGAGMAYLLSAFGRSGARVLEAMAAPIAAVFRAAGWRGMADLFAPE